MEPTKERLFSVTRVANTEEGRLDQERQCGGGEVPSERSLSCCWADGVQSIYSVIEHALPGALHEAGVNWVQGRTKKNKTDGSCPPVIFSLVGGSEKTFTPKMIKLFGP